MSREEESGNDAITFFNAFSEKVSTGTLTPEYIELVSAATVWTGLFGTAYIVYAQNFGQRMVTNPTDANLIYSLQPLFTSVFAFLLLGETMGPTGFLGGSLIGAAIYMVATKGMENEKESSKTVGG